MKISRRSLLAFALLGTLTAPLFPSPAQADPSVFARRKDRNADREPDRNNDRETDRNADRNVSVVGIVDRDLAGQDRFTLRLESGRTVEVISRDREPVRLSRGDRVEVRGDFEKQLFIADRVRILDNRGNGNGNGNGNNPGQNQTLQGRVIRDYFGRDFELLRDNGDRIRVRSLRAEPIRLSNGDRLAIQGAFEGRIFMARDVDITRNDDRQSVDFPATVVRRTDAGRMTVRGDNGRTYIVISGRQLMRFDRDDRVRVKGFINGDIVAVSSVELLRNR